MQPRCLAEEGRAGLGMRGVRAALSSPAQPQPGKVALPALPAATKAQRGRGPPSHPHRLAPSNHGSHAAPTRDAVSLSLLCI